MQRIVFAMMFLTTSFIGFNSKAQTNSTDPQVVCVGYSGGYQVDYLENAGAGTTGSTYTWSVITPGFLGVITTNQGPGSSSNRVLINWGATPVGIYQLQVIETNTGCPSTPVLLNIQLVPTVTPTFAAIGPLCQNSAAPALPANSTNGIAGTWNPATISTATIGTTTYTFTPNAGQCATTTTLNVNITNQITPTFAAIGPLCQNSAAPALPANSSNGIAGTWNPATISTATIGTTTYTFTPNAGQCANTTTLNVNITNQITPTFAAIGPFCQNSAAPALPANSSNGIAGTWSPATISTTTIGTTTYTFTPNAGQCATTTTLNVNITNQITPTFAAIGPFCQNSAAPALSANSSNGIAGTWNPATVSTTTLGTTTYTFTPNAGQCATTTTLNVNITNQITPTFAAIGPLCQNSAAPVLPANSTNGIAGTWSPATISTTTLGTTIYTFTPNAGQCATITTLNVNITNQITPTFAAIGPICQNSAAPALPANSTNGIAGTWNPATVSTTTLGTTTYTFTPNAGQCATTTTLNVNITNQITPTFAAIGSLCQNSTAPTLPANSTNGIAGTWNPATISTTTLGTTTYTFTPNAGQCATTTTLNVNITNQITPTFAAIGPLCQNSTAPTLPANSTNGIAGTWNPATISTTTLGTTTYTFTPNAGQCATTTTLNVNINPPVVPMFTALGPYCQNDAAPTLPLVSSNGITGIWNPATISTTAVGTTPYTFTPTAGQCSSPYILNVVTNALPNTSPIFHD